MYVDTPKSQHDLQLFRVLHSSLSICAFVHVEVEIVIVRLQLIFFLDVNFSLMLGKKLMMRFAIFYTHISA